jgi:intein/homing endonuclease
LEWYESPLYQLPSGTPQTFQLSSEPPLSFDVDITPNQPGVYEALVSQSGTPFAPPASTLLGIPDDWAFVLEYGALADLLGRESEATDRERAAYCFPAGTKIAMGDTSLKSIEDVKEGEIVVTHTGERHKVTELIPSERISTICKISSFGFEDIEATEEHPFLVIPYSWRKTQTKKVKITRDKFLRGKAASWLMAKEISDGDIVMRPIEPVHNNSKTNDEYGWLLGIYLAEGGVSSSREGLPPKSSRFEFHIAEQDFADRVIELSKAMDVESTYSIYKRSWANSFTLRINSKKVAGWLLEMGGKGAKTKSLSSKVYGFGEAFIRKVIKGWADGDGNFPSRKCPSHKKMNRVLRVATASLTLANQMQSLAASVGVVARVSKIERMTNIAYQVIWMVIFQSDAADAVLEERGPCLVSNYSKIFIYNGYLCSHVSSVSRRTYHGKLYNFSVDKDNSYIANGYAVHNCLKRYQDYLTVITKTPWIMLGSVNGVACSVDALEDTDQYSVGWDLDPSNFGPVIVTAGVDTFASPVGSSIGITCLGNAPLLDSSGTYLQVSRDQWDTVLDLAQSLASFKLGGAEWKAALELEARAIKFAAAENSRLKSLGAFTDVILQRGGAQDRVQERYSSKSNRGAGNAG